MYADDTQLHNSTLPEHLHLLRDSTSACFADIKNWMTRNKLQLNGEKTEAMLSGTKHKLSSVSTTELYFEDNTLSVPLSLSVKNLGVTLDNTLSMQKFISQTSQSCHYHLRRISAIRKYLSSDATAKLVSSFILSRLDYCNSLLAGLPASSIQPLQRIQTTQLALSCA
jgi:hypothetical protein